MTEGFRPLPNTRSTDLFSKIINKFRKVIDFQLLTIYNDAKKVLPFFKGKILDIGCGDSPYRQLLSAEETEYIGIDIIDSASFDYNNSDIIPFNGKEIPFAQEHFDAVICTEVLEHVSHFQSLVDEIFRVMKPGAIGFITIPWSARFHYIPYDYFRYTPSCLKIIFQKFNSITIYSRGSDITSITNKLIVLWFRNMTITPQWRILFLPIWIVFMPLLIISIIIAHISLLFQLGSNDDPLGYTIVITK
jgi:ubiquinone/menaquinone biosynthesis C-methylase UbiE